MGRFIVLFVFLVLLHNYYYVNNYMFNAPDQGFYSFLYCKIFTILFIFQCICIKRRLFIVLSITLLFSHQVKYGTIPFYWYDGNESFDVVMFTVKRSVERQEIFRENYQFASLPRYSTYYGAHDKDDITELTTPRQRGNYALYMNFINATKNSFKIKRPKKWILMFADDAYIYPWFAHRFRSALYWYDGYDIIWLDTTNALGWVLLRRVYSRISGIAFSSNSLSKIATLLDFNNELYVKHIKNWTSDNPPYYLDIVLAEYCNLGVLRCAHMPISHDRGLKSSVD